jgi:5'-deoxynucleotidase YfbR-like HD superfamily hydrolase
VIEAGHHDLALAALHHDSHEAFTCDIPSPLKRKLEDEGDVVYRQVCAALDVVIAERFGFVAPAEGTEQERIIKLADEQARVIEARTLLRNRGASIEATVHILG